MTLLVRATCRINGKPAFQTRPHGTKTPEPMDLKFDTNDYVGDITPYTKVAAPVSTRSGATYA